MFLSSIIPSSLASIESVIQPKRIMAIFVAIVRPSVARHRPGPPKTHRVCFHQLNKAHFVTAIKINAKVL